MGVTTKTDNRKMSVNASVGGKKRKSCSGDWDIAAKDIPASGKKLKKAIGKQQGVNEKIPQSASRNEVQNKTSPKKIKDQVTKISSGKPFSKKQNSEVKKRESIDTGDPTPKKHKVLKDSSGEEPTSKKKKGKQKKQNNEAPANASVGTELNKRDKTNIFPEWSAEDLLKLLERIESKSPKLLSLKAVKAVDEIDWEGIAFRSFSAEDCRVTWLKLQEISRGPRELVCEVRKMLVEKLPKYDVKHSQSKSTPKESDEEEEVQQDDDDKEDEEQDDGEVWQMKDEDDDEEEEDGEEEEDSEDD